MFCYHYTSLHNILNRFLLFILLTVIVQLELADSGSLFYLMFHTVQYNMMDVAQYIVEFPSFMRWACSDAVVNDVVKVLRR